ncbi:hypothetical protein INS49_005896 [Diaporthe citri]|uniref:uncharacterized protein n=1 Tax=Diaporthe citri TaxID=83186 RepID=UPI001C7F5BB8|nr:uncharacterized protein INS49_005896 [Diaporthe citri]KAG6364296.1 hypothetical protein INS49_005896 [Diaporthe citri]
MSLSRGRMRSRIKILDRNDGTYRPQGYDRWVDAQLSSVLGPGREQPTATSITGAIVQLANPSRSHEGVVLPTKAQLWSRKAATVGRSEESASMRTSAEVGHFWTDVREAHGRVWGIFGSSQKGAVLLPITA